MPSGGYGVYAAITHWGAGTKRPSAAALPGTFDLYGPFDWSPGWAAASMQAWQRLLPELASRKARRGQPIFEQGARPESLYLLRSGLVKVATVLVDGAETVIDIRAPGEILYWHHPEQPCACYRGTGVPLVESEVLRAPLALFFRQVQSRELSALVLDNLLRDLSLQYSRLCDAKTVDAETRLERLLARLARVTGLPDSHGGIRLRVPLTDGELAQTLGISLRHLRRVRSELKAQGRIWPLSGRWLSLPRRFTCRQGPR